MFNAFLNLFDFFVNNFYLPLFNALNESTILDVSSNFISNFLTAFFKLWNNDNSFVFNSQDVVKLLAEVLTFLVIVFIFKIAISMFNLIFNTIRKAL